MPFLFNFFFFPLNLPHTYTPSKVIRLTLFETHEITIHCNLNENMYRRIGRSIRYGKYTTPVIKQQKSVVVGNSNNSVTNGPFCFRHD